MQKLSSKKNIIFDLDGVLLDSLKNMLVSWNSVNKKFDLNISFNEYYKHIGIPFKDILKSLKIKKSKFSLIEKQYTTKSFQNLNKVKFYPNVLSTLKYLKKKKYFLGILTSKDKVRTDIILKKLNIKFDVIQCPQKNYKGKPSSDLIKKIIKDTKLKRNECIYIGDSIYDLVMCRAAKVDFLFAKYGYKIGIQNYKHKINKFSDIQKIL